MKRAVVAAVFLGILGACVRIPPSRMLPMTINTIYVPIFVNKTYEPGLEEKATRAVQEEFLVDGRLDVNTRRNADAILVGTLLKWNIMPSRFSVDEFPMNSRINIVADVALYDPADTKREKPLMLWEDIMVDHYFVSDARRVIEVSPDDAYEDALRALARVIVRTVMTRPPQSRAAELTATVPFSATGPKKVLGREKVDTKLFDALSTHPVTVRDVEEKPEKAPEE